MNGTAPPTHAQRRLGAFVVAVVITHHLGSLTGPLGDVGATGWGDWIDLITPYAVVGTALLTLVSARPDRLTWGLAALGAVVYVQGHGIHLSANSIGNVRGNAAPVHLWDEVVGHYLWYAGLALLVLALVRAVDIPTTALSLLGAVAFGVTHATNGIEGGTAVASTLVALAFAVAFRRRLPVVVAYGTATLVLVGWGAYWEAAEGRWFPQPSELGWF